ncbi:MAG TPA: serine hydrolase [Parvularcula sp.]|nr:serine hydrolase [Parvularcula sp.]
MRALWIAAALLASPALGADDPAHLSLVAGYKAAFTCSAHFNAGRSVREIAADELNRIYPDYREAMARLPDAVIDEAAKTVSVSYADGLPPRLAAWRPYLGCVAAPTMGGAAALKATPRLSPRDVAFKAPRNGGRDRNTIVLDLDNAALDALVSAAFDRKTYGEGTETTAVLIVKDGAVVAEKYRDGFDENTPQRTWSAAKSIAATIIGAAVQEGLIDIDEPAALAQWRAPGDPRGAITIRHLLNMASGLDSGPAGNRTDDIYFGGGRVIDHAATRRLVAAPGSAFVYANNDTMLLMRALRERMKSDKAYLAFPFRKVLGPVGLDRTFLETDWNGDFVLSSQVWTTARDLARLGQLYLDDGVAGGARILPEGWADFVSTPAPAQPADRRAGENRPGYGAQFWLFGARHGLPEGSYAALGNRGQFLLIIPARRMLVVRRGFDDGGGFDIAAFARDALAALDE